jgi:hypothetical protein
MCLWSQLHASDEPTEKTATTTTLATTRRRQEDETQGRLCVACHGDDRARRLMETRFTFFRNAHCFLIRRQKYPRHTLCIRNDPRRNGLYKQGYLLAVGRPMESEARLDAGVTSGLFVLHGVIDRTDK